MRNDSLGRRIAQLVESRDARARMIHLDFTTWSIERKMIADRISQNSIILGDIAGIIADYTGSAHGRAIELIHNAHKHIFTSIHASVANQKTRISAGELISNFERLLGELGYRPTMVPCSTYGPPRETRVLILDLLYKIIVEREQVSRECVTDMFYQVILLNWTDHASTVE